MSDVNTIKNWLSIQEADMIATLKALCEINSGSTHLNGLKKVHELLFTLFQPLADVIETPMLAPVSLFTMDGELETLTTGPILFIRKRPHLRNRILLCGHMDTVYGKDSPFQSLTQINPNVLQGPGVADMKGGLIVMLYALKAFEQLPNASELGWDVLINADEEIGSPASSVFIEQIAPQYKAGFVYEPAMTNEGLFAKNRKGSGKFTMIATGREAHAGRDFSHGRNAICYLAKAILEIDKLNGQHPGSTFNIGLIKGGSSVNSVPQRAVAKIDIRIEKPEDEPWVTRAINQIFNKLHHPDYQLTLHGHFSRPVKSINAKTKILFERLQSLAKMQGYAIDWANSGGCCDGNNLSKQGIAVIDTLGVKGGHIHTAQEYICLDSLVERALLSALLFQDILSVELV